MSSQIKDTFIHTSATTYTYTVYAMICKLLQLFFIDTLILLWIISMQNITTPGHSSIPSLFSMPTRVLCLYIQFLMIGPMISLFIWFVNILCIQIKYILMLNIYWNARQMLKQWCEWILVCHVLLSIVVWHDGLEEHQHN